MLLWTADRVYLLTAESYTGMRVPAYLYVRTFCPIIHFCRISVAKWTIWLFLPYNIAMPRYCKTIIYTLPFLLYLLLVTGWTVSFAQSPRLSFQHIGSEEGLSNSTIEVICQDDRGFIWFGTRDGLNRYDGYQVTIFRYKTGDSTSITDNYIRSLYTDRHGNLWVGTMNGLNRFVPGSNSFVRYKHDPRDDRSLSHNLVSAIGEDGDGNLWIGTGGGIQRYDAGKDCFVRIGIQTSFSEQVHVLFRDHNGRLWAGTESGIFVWDGDKKNWIPLQYLLNKHATPHPLNKEITEHSTQHPLSKRTTEHSTPHPLNKEILTIAEDSTGTLWFGTRNNGVLLYHPKEQAFTVLRHEEKKAGSLAGNQLRAVLAGKSGRIWVGGINAGLNLFDPVSGRFHHYENNPDETSSLSQRTVSALFEDRQGNLWIGTHRGGVNQYHPLAGKFPHYRQEPGLSSLSYNDVKAFCEDDKGRIWVGTDGGGLNLFNRQTRKFIHYKYNAFDASSIGSNEVLHIKQDSRVRIWVGTWGGGLNRFYPETGRFERYLHNPADPSSISANYVQQIYEDSRQQLWVATYYGGLNRFDPETGRFTRITELNNTQLQGNNIVSLAEDAAGRLWIGTDDGGLNCLNPSTGRISHYFDQEEKFPDLRVIFSDSKGRLWAGQAGLFLFDAQHDRFQPFADKAELSREFIKGITEDEQGYFWISTSNGLTRYHPDTHVFKKYNTADGLQGTEFEANAYMRARDGQMYFGGVNGFNAFYPSQIRINEYIPPVYITELQLFNKKIVPGEKGSPLQQDISLTKKITLSYKQSSLSFTFAALNYLATENNQYAYRLEGLNNSWIYAGRERKAIYTNLDPGEYIFSVKAANNDGRWNEEGTSLVIRITPPVWATWWFRTLVALVLLAAVYYYLRFRRRRQESIMEERKREEMHKVQLQFFTNISHEFRTPLSLILGPLEQLEKEDLHSSYQHYYKVMHLNASRLLSLVNELMDFRKVESGHLRLRVMPGKMALFLQEIAEEFSELANRKQIDFRTKMHIGPEDAWFDRQLLEKIVINLVSNAFKYTSDGGRITLEAFTSMEKFRPSFVNELHIRHDFKGKKYLFIRVADNGIGISKESIRHLFERYYKITDSHLGSGIGLAFVKSLTQLHKGNIFVYSERNEGTEIIIGIPVSRNDYLPEERWMTASDGAHPRLESLHHKINNGEDAAAPQLEPGMEVPALQHRYHILIVDDNAELRRFLLGILAPFYAITEAADGAEGLQKAREMNPDLIISDVMMPEMDGNTFCRNIKENVETSHIPFLMLTAREAHAAQLEGMGAGADFYFAKPLSIDLLLLTIRNIFEQREKLKEKYRHDHHAAAREMVHASKDAAFMEEFLAITDSQLTNPDLDVEYICNKIGMSRTKLYQKIKGITGQSIGEFVRTLRLRKAVEIMTTEDVLLTEVMYRVGIQTQSYFTKAFKKEYGKTPTQFLQELGK